MNSRLKIFAILSVVLLAGCSIDEPVLPRWVVPFVIPLAPERLVFEDEVVNDSTLITADNVLSIQIEKHIPPEQITEDDLTISGIDTATSFSLDSLDMDSLETMSTDLLNVTELISGLPGLIGQTAIVPEQTFNAQLDTVSSEEFRAILIEDGMLEISIHNQFPFTLGPNSTSTGMQVTVYDSLNSLVAQVLITDSIPPGATVSGQSPLLSTDWIYAPLTLEYDIPIAHEDSFLVTQTLLDTSNFSIDIFAHNLVVAEIIGKVPEQSFADEWKLYLDSPDKVIRADISSGQINLNFINELPVELQVDFTIPDLLTPNGSAYQDQLIIAANNSSNTQIILDGFALINSQNPQQPLDSLLVAADFSSPASSGFIHLKRTDKVDANLHLDDLIFSRLEGFLARDTLQMDPFEQNDIADYEGFAAGIRFQEAQMLIELDNEIQIDSLFLNLKITGYHKDRNGVITDSAIVSIEDEQINSGGTDTLLFAGPEIANLLNILPTDLKGSGSVVYGGHANVAAGDEIGANFTFSTPFIIEIVDADPFRFDPDTLTGEDIDVDVRDALEEDIKSAILRAKVLNHSPLGGSATLFISGDSLHADIYDTTAYFNPEKEFVKHIVIRKAPVNPVTHLVENPEVSEIQIPLSTRELRIFKYPPLRTGFSIDLEETNGVVKLQGTDFIEVSGQLQVTVVIHDDDN